MTNDHTEVREIFADYFKNMIMKVIMNIKVQDNTPRSNDNDFYYNSVSS